MVVGSGLGGSLAVAPETVYGTYVAGTTFWDLMGGESYEKKMNIVQGGGPAAGRPAQAASQRFIATEAAGGSHTLEVKQKQFGIWLRHLFGSVTNPVQQAATLAYLQTHALGDNIGKSLSLQFGVPDRQGAMKQKTIKGGKITAIEFSCGADQPTLMAAIDIDGQRFSEVEGYVSPSFTAPAPQAFNWMHMSLKLGAFGAEANAPGVRKVTMKLERPQSTDDYYAGATIPGTKDEPIWGDFFKVTGTVETDLKDKTAFVDRFHTQSSTSMVWDFTNIAAPISGVLYPRFALTTPAVFFTGGTQMLSDNGVVKVSHPFEGQWDATNGLVSALYQSTDLTIV